MSDLPPRRPDDLTTDRSAREELDALLVGEDEIDLEALKSWIKRRAHEIVQEELARRSSSSNTRSTPSR